MEVRHITIVTGYFATALPVYLTSTNYDLATLVHSMIGLLAVGIINISVSFVLAFLLASVSSKVKFRSFLKLLKSGTILIFFKPWLLILPEDTNSKDSEN